MIYSHLLKRKHSINRQNVGFAIPTVLVASIIMLTVLVVAISSVATARVALRDQYYAKLTQFASDAGFNYAYACLDANNGIPQWSDDKPLRPNTDCQGNELTQCPENTLDVNCSVLVDGNITTSFTVKYPSKMVDGVAYSVMSDGSVNVVRKTSGTSFKQFSHAAVVDRAYQAISQIVMGSSHGCMTSTSGAIYCWGGNINGQIGDGTSGTAMIRSTATPVDMSGALNGLTVKTMSSSWTHTCIMASNNRPYCWGYGYGTTPLEVVVGGAAAGKTVKSIYAGQAYTCVIAGASGDNLSDNLYCWGNGAYGKFGNGSTTSRDINDPATPLRTGALSAGLYIKSVAPGYDHICVIASDGNAYCMGEGSYGRLGYNSDVDSTAPVKVYNDAGSALDGKTIKSISAGMSGTCVIASDNQAYCWGNYPGNGATQSFVPVSPTIDPLLTGKTIKSISRGYQHTCVVASDSKAYCWGSSVPGLSTYPYTVPVDVSVGMFGGKKVKSIVAGPMSRNFTQSAVCALTYDNVVNCFGDNTDSRLGVPKRNGGGFEVSDVIDTAGAFGDDGTVESISAGGEYTCAVSHSKASCWGYGVYGQIGAGVYGTNNNNPLLVSFSSDKIVTVLSTSSYSHTCAIASGLPYCWGNNNTYQLGWSSFNTTSNTPRAVYVSGTIANITPPAAMLDKTVTDITAGYNHSCAIASGEAYCWGGSAGTTGDGTSTVYKVPAKVSNGAGTALAGLTVKDISAGNGFTCAIAGQAGNVLSDNVYCWGTGLYGELGDGLGASSLVPVKVANGSGTALYGLVAKSLSASYSHACVVAGLPNVTTSDNAYCWGYNSTYQIGDDSSLANHLVPYKVNFGSLTVKSISAGTGHTCAIASDNKAYCWGSGLDGRLGTGDTDARYTPVVVNNGQLFKSISAGGAHTCAVSMDNKPFCWGENYRSQLGNSPLDSSSTSILPQDLPPIIPKLYY